MKIVKHIVLELLLLIGLIMCSIVVVKVFDVLFNLENESILKEGIKTGFLAWFILLIIQIIKRVKNDKKSNR